MRNQQLAQPTSIKKGETYKLEFWSYEHVAVPRHGWKLNQVRVNGHELYLPPNSQKVGSKSQVYDFGNGMQAVVEVIDEQYSWSGVGDYFKIRLTITHVNSNLHIEKINFKNGKRYEVINRNIEYFDDIDNWYAEDHAWQYSDITERDNVIENVSGKVDDTMNYPQFIFVKLKDGYAADDLKVYINDSETESIKLLPISELENQDFGKYNENVKVYLQQKMEEVGKPLEESYTHFIQVPEGKDVKFSYSSTKETYHILYKLNGGNWSYEQEDEYDYFENSIVKIPTFIPTREGYSFIGWKIGDKIYEPGQYIDITQDKNFYNSRIGNEFQMEAQWQKNDEPIKDVYWNYTVTLQQQVKNGNPVKIISHQYQVKKSPDSYPQILLNKIVEELKEEADYEIPKGYEEVYDNFQTIEDNNDNLIVSYNAIEFHIDYVGIPASSTNPNSQTYSILSDEIVLQNPIEKENDNIVFDGWYWDKEMTKPVQKINPEEHLKDIKIFAKYLDDKNNDNIPDDEQRVHIQYDANGGVNAPQEKEYLVKDKYYIAEKENMSHPDKYAFAGWTTTPTESPVTKQPEGIILPKTELSQDNAGTYIYYAVWAVDENENGKPDYEEGKYRLRYDANGGVGAPVDSNLYLPDTGCELSSQKPTRENAIFYGWSLEKDVKLYEQKPDFEPLKDVKFVDKDITVYAVWLKDTDGDGIPDYEETKYSLTYDANGGINAPIDNNTYINKQVVTLSTDYPTRENAVCIGWSLNKYVDLVSQKPDDIISSYTFNENNTTVYAVWAIDNDGDGQPDYEQDIELEYDTNGGTNIPNTKHKGGEEVLLKDKIPTKEHAIFLGWSLEDYGEDFTSEPTDIKFIDSIVIDASRNQNIVHAVWAADKDDDGKIDYEQYKLIYDYNDGSGFVDIDSDFYDENESVSLTKTLNNQKGAVFGGWSLEKNEGILQDEDELISPKIDTITFRQNDITLYAIWYIDANGDGTPDYNEDRYTLSYDTNGGTAIESTEHLKGTSVALEDKIPAKDNAVFLGWSLEDYEEDFASEPSEVKFVSSYEFSMDDPADASVHAVWAADANGDGTPDYNEDRYTLSYDTNGGTAIESTEHLKGTSVALEDKIPAKDNAVFLGWSLEDYEEDFASEPSEVKFVSSYEFSMDDPADASVHAVWAADANGDGTPDYNEDRYTLSYDTNGGTAIESTEHLKGTSVALEDKIPAKDNAVFLGWSLEDYEEDFASEPSEVKFVSSYEFSMDDPADASVHAVWAADANGDGTPDYNEDRYTLSYDTNGGTAIESTEHLKGTSVALEDKIPAKDNAVFLGWSLEDYEEDFASEPSEVKFVSSYEFSMDDPADASVHAVWAADDNGNGRPDYQEQSIVTVEVYAGDELVSRNQTEMQVGQTYSVDNILQSITHEGRTYLLDHIDNNHMIVNVNEEDNVVRIYYQLQQTPIDPAHPIDPTNPIDPTTPVNPGDNNQNPVIPGNNGGTGATPRTPVANGGVVRGNANTPMTNTPEANTTEIEDNQVPQGGLNETQDIQDNQTPLAKNTQNKSWSIVNLILAILSIISAIAIAVKKREVLFKYVSVGLAIVSTIAFVLTQNIGAKMIMFDSWTILFVVILLIQLGTYIYSKKDQGDK